MDRTRTMRVVRLAPLGLAATLALGACTAGASPTPAPSDAMMDHSAAPSDAMMDHSAAPSDAMMDHSAAPSDAMMDHSAAPSAAGQATPVSTGTFHKVDGSAAGTAALFHRADGTFLITFEDFQVDSSTGIHVVLVPNKDITSDGDVDRTAIVDLGALKGTSGMQDFPVPSSADAMTYHTVVLWDTEMAHAVAAAPLQ